MMSVARVPVVLLAGPSRDPRRREQPSPTLTPRSQVESNREPAAGPSRPVKQEGRQGLDRARPTSDASERVASPDIQIIDQPKPRPRPAFRIPTPPRQPLPETLPTYLLRPVRAYRKPKPATAGPSNSTTVVTRLSRLATLEPDGPDPRSMILPERIQADPFWANGDGMRESLTASSSIFRSTRTHVSSAEQRLRQIISIEEPAPQSESRPKAEDGSNPASRQSVSAKRIYTPLQVGPRPPVSRVPYEPGHPHLSDAEETGERKGNMGVTAAPLRALPEEKWTRKRAREVPGKRIGIDFWEEYSELERAVKIHRFDPTAIPRPPQ